MKADSEIGLPPLAHFASGGNCAIYVYMRVPMEGTMQCASFPTQLESRWDLSLIHI